MVWHVTRRAVNRRSAVRRVCHCTIYLPASIHHCVFFFIQSCYLYHLATTPCGVSQHLCNLALSIQHVSIPPTVSRCTESIAFRVLSASSSIGLWIGYVYVSKIILVLHTLYALAFQIRRARMLCLLRWRRTVHLEWRFPTLCHGRYHTPS